MTPPPSESKGVIPYIIFVKPINRNEVAAHCCSVELAPQCKKVFGDSFTLPYPSYDSLNWQGQEGRGLVGVLKQSMIAGATVGFVSAAGGAAIGYPQAPSQLTIASRQLDKGSGRGQVAYARADVPIGYRLKIYVPKPFALASLSQNNTCRGFAMTGGYTSARAAVPDGLIVVAGKVRGKDNLRQDGGIVQTSGSVVTLHRASLPRPSASSGTDQIYSQPILISNGLVDGRFRKGKANRVALGKYRDGGLFMIMAYNGDANGMSAVTLSEFANDVIILSPKKVDWLINFDGGPSAFLASPGHAITFTNGSVTSYLCAEPSNG